MSEYVDKSQWPVWAEEPIIIEEPTPMWQVMGEEEKKKLFTLLGAFAVKEIEHIGSTSIPNLPAKPIIDMMAKIKDFGQLKEIIQVLEEFDWHYVPQDLDQREWRRYFVKVHNDKRVAHLHLVKEGTQRWDEHLKFRDTLRENKNVVQEYASLKKRLAIKFTDDREAYTEAKSQFIQSIIKQ
ncbi:GrpB family protein [Alkalicoccobacillus porphyridii]|uniref:GrpB family protein n=1 Tax=Alkalicoccobacillus porphyridii TaxID=2597270 RepID=UPI0021B12A70|nr:GrpB family protein [Alkalicoccobacillus porphyridii]